MEAASEEAASEDAASEEAASLEAASEEAASETAVVLAEAASEAVSYTHLTLPTILLV